MNRNKTQHHKVAIFTLLLLSIAIYVHAQVRDIRFRLLDIDNGLSQNSGNCLIQDNTGFIWIGTEAGLNRYDGYNFTVYTYDRNDPNSISNSYILSICKDRSGLLWIGTGKGLTTFDPKTETFTRFLHDPKNPGSISNNRILSICEDSYGFIWVGTELGLNKYDKKKNKFTGYYHYPGDKHSLSHNIVREVYEDNHKTLWIGTYGGGFNKYDRKKDRFFRYRNDPEDTLSISSNKVLTIFQDHEGVLWIGTEGGGLNKFNRENEAFFHYQYNIKDPGSISDDNINVIYESKSGELWIGTNDGGINLFDRDKNTFFHFKHNSGIPTSLINNRIESIAEDRTGGIWFGTRGGGINIYFKDMHRFTHYKADQNNPNSLSHNGVRPIYEDTAGIFWIGADGGGLNRFDREKGTFVHYKHNPHDPFSINDNRVFAICEDSTGILWIGTNGSGLNGFDRRYEIFAHYTHDPEDSFSISDNRIRDMLIDKDGDLWIGTNGGGLNKFDFRTDKFTRYQNIPGDTNSLSSDRIYCVYEDRASTIWVGTFAGGLNKFDKKTQKFTRYKNDTANVNSISKDFILAIYEDTEGMLWIGTVSGGLNKFDRSKNIFTRYSTKDGLPDDLIYDILEDSKGNLWMSTNRGLSKFNPKTGRFKNYDVKDGLQSNEFNTGTGFVSSSGEMLFGGVNGFNIFHPDSIKDNIHIPSLVITEFEIFNTPVPVGQMEDGRTILSKPLLNTRDITLSYKDNVFSFGFAALHFVYPERNQYAYKMEGLETKWNYVKGRRYATYTTLPPGKYVFSVKGSNNDGVWNEKGTAIKIRIIPPFWRTLWFYLLVLTVIIAIAALVFRYQIELAKKQKEEDARRRVTETFSQALEQGSTAVYRRNFNLNIYEYIGEGIHDLTGYSADEITPDIWDKITISVENKGELANLPAEKANRLVRTGKVNRWLSDTKIKTKTGEIRWVMDMSTVLRDANGDSYGCLGILFDITDRKLAEEQLAKTSEELSVRNLEMETDLNMAREVQMAFLDKHPARFPEKASGKKRSLKFSHRYLPATTLAGDFFDILPISNHQAGVLICDVMGHGARASLLTAYLQGQIEELMPVAADPNVFIRKLNIGINSIMTQFHTGVFATVFYLVADIKSGKIHYTNAGHPGPFILRKNEGIIEQVYCSDRKAEPALGLVNDFNYSVYESPISRDDMVLLFTDGIYEVEDGKGEIFGKDRLLSSLQTRLSMAPDLLLDKIIEEIKSFSHTKEFKDDVCLVTLHVR
jgi:PAS domain S-box-containing protein